MGKNRHFIELFRLSLKYLSLLQYSLIFNHLRWHFPIFAATLSFLANFPFRIHELATNGLIPISLYAYSPDNEAEKSNQHWWLANQRRWLQKPHFSFAKQQCWLKNTSRQKSFSKNRFIRNIVLLMAFFCESDKKK